MALQEIKRLNKRLIGSFEHALNFLRREYFPQFFLALAVNVLLLIFQFAYIALRYTYLNESIPLWYSMPWGDFQLDYKRNLYIIPILSSVILTAGISIITMMRKLYVRYLPQLTTLIVTVSNITLSYSLARIVSSASTPFPSIIRPDYFPLILPFSISLVATYFIAPLFISWFKERGIVTDPASHSHPGMILTRPSARGGGVIFSVVFIVVSLLFVPVNSQLLGLYIAVLLLALLGYADDYQNTHLRSIFRFLETPYLRLFLLFIVVAIIPALGVKIGFISNPFGEAFDFTQMELVSAVVTVVWIVWILNLLSWSNGIDGQYSGIIGISSIVIGLLALRFVPLPPEYSNYAKLAMIAAGCSLGLVRYTWYPSKIMWGFSALSAGVVISVLSILVNAKVATSIIIILVPFLDGSVTFIRRILQGKNPLKGDKGHLHHLLIERGWSVPRIAVFYWISTAVFGIIGLLSAEKNTILVTLMIAGVVAFFIVLLNLKSASKKQI